ncbi:phage scaffolding protein [Mammaliicoccus lentus]|uniref:Phage scaffolding protein n=1 Tax=Mammaliicoccus lentus TaxID=42858 RepID=A0ABS6GT58_MAMLE|nr:phage scaffolding protein [Mammaliicoccus lentus]MBU6112540.1 phage scaffolding protein [Mammaliicoccus lentus]
MNRETLKALELSDEQIDKVMAEHGKSVSDKQSQIDETNNKVKELENDKESLSKQVTALEKKANDYNSLEEKNNQLQEEIKDYKVKVATNDLDKQILKEVSKDAHDPDDVFLFIDKDKFNRDEETGEVTNFNDVMQELRSSKAYLFNQSSNPAGSESNPEGKEEKPGNPEYKSGGQQGNGKQKFGYSKRGKELAESIYGKNKEE